MESLKSETIPPPPGVIGSIKAGFDTIASHVTAILLPLVLDLFLWLGPRLSMEKLYQSIQPEMLNFWRAGGFSAEDIQRVSEFYTTTLPKLNLFWLARAVPIGISSLFFARDVQSTPLGVSSIMSVTSNFDLLGWMFILTVVGWIGGGVYFRSISRLVTVNGQIEPPGTGRAIGQTILVSILWTGVVMAIGIPLVIILAILIQASSIVAQISILLFSFLSMWLIVPIFFWPHGVFIYRQNALSSIFNSVRLARFTLPTSSMFVLTVFLLNVGLNFLWVIPPEDSWMTVIGILGHAFVTTALLAGSFIYYRDLNSWVQGVVERLKSKSLTRI
jgi:hypothetical protein